MKRPRTSLNAVSLWVAVFAYSAFLAGCLNSAETGEQPAANPTSGGAPETDAAAEKRDSADGTIAAGANQATHDVGASSAGPSSHSAMVDAASVTPADAGMAAPAMAAPAVGSGLPCDVQAILAARCGMCHGDPALFGAPMPLTRHAQFQRPAATDGSKKVYQAVQARINATSRQMPPLGSAPLAPDELATLNAWLERGAPESGEKCRDMKPATGTVDAGALGDVTELECYKFLAHAPGDKKAKYPLGVATDLWVETTFQSAWQGEAYAQVIRPVIDNTSVLHHWTLYIQPGTDGDVQAGTNGLHPGGTRVSGWGPGGQNTDFRRLGDVGLPLPSATYVLEIHYNSSDPNAQDASGVELCMNTSPPKTLLGNSRLGYINSFLVGDFGGPRTTWTGVCRPMSQEPIHIVYATPHMHRTGRRMQSIITATDGSTRTLLDVPFDFESQTSYELNAVLMPGEFITTTCNFSEPKSTGESTNDEMCHLFTYSYPRGALVDHALLGEVLFDSTSYDCLGQ